MEPFFRGPDQLTARNRSGSSGSGYKGPKSRGDLRDAGGTSVASYLRLSDRNQPIIQRLVGCDRSAFLFIKIARNANPTFSSETAPLTAPHCTITEKVIKDPNQILRQALAGQEIEPFVTFELTTQAARSTPAAPRSADPFVGGGTSNIGFLQGTDDASKMLDGDAGNAHAIKMTVRYWIEIVAATLDVKPEASAPQEFRMVSAAGVLGPTFVVSAAATKDLSAVVMKRVTWTQIQYSHNVTLNFNGLSWPHVSVATLGDTSRVEVAL